MSLKRFPSPLDGADAVHVGMFDWVPRGVPVSTSDQIWLHISPGLDVAQGEFSGPLSNCGLVCNTKQLFFSLCVFEWSDCFLWLLKFIFFLFCSFCTILIQGHFQEISWSQLPAGSLSPPSPGVFTTSRSLPEGDDQPCSVVHFSWYAFVSVTNLDYP